MITTCRSDIDYEAIRLALVDNGSPLFPWTSGGREIHRLPRARSGISWLLQTLGLGAGDEVLLPDFMCGRVAGTIAAAGARPVTFGLTAESLLPSLDSCEASLSPSCKVLLVPHFFGMRTPLEGFRALADRHRLTLVEDSAHRAPDGHPAAESMGDCTLYSFNMAKPLTLGTGGGLTLSPSLRALVDPPAFDAMDRSEDRLFAAAFLLQHFLTDSAQIKARFLSLDFSVGYLLTLQKRRDHSERSSSGELSDVDSLVDGILEAAQATRPERLLAECCESNSLPPRRSSGSRLPAVVKRRLKALGPSVRDPRKVLAESGRAVPAQGGLCDRLLGAQWARLAEATDSARRVRIAAIYSSGLDRERWMVPESNLADHWVAFPVVARRGITRDRLVDRAAKRVGIDVFPYMWPNPVHQLAHMRDVARVGSGCENTGRLISGLLNLPVHRQVTEDQALRLVDFLNRA